MRPQSWAAASIFFFSSRRRHTRSLRDWSSDVCSSDLLSGIFNTGGGRGTRTKPATERGKDLETSVTLSFEQALSGAQIPVRSEERRVGKECRCRGSPVQQKMKC